MQMGEPIETVIGFIICTDVHDLNVYIYAFFIFVTHRVQHPNIVKLYEMYDDKSKVYLVMEL